MTTSGGAAPLSVLIAQLERARTLGFLGPGPVEDHLTHAQAFVAALDEVRGRIADLGSGAGIPGLPVALARPDLEVVLLDASAKRCALLEDTVRALGLAGRVSVAHGRAEVLGRTELRGTFEAVLARSFGRPAVTAECAAPLLRVGGRLLVSEPPGSGDRWPAEPLGALGLEPLARHAAGPQLQILAQVAACPDSYPRRDGTPAKQPLF